ncbi:hypothetical protein RJK19_00450 [Buchnera aphidicola (Ceratovacuna keduensis)]|uniref:primosomal protein N' family DNA-binding protein n=1 Tax=Buchnera aphidicola TaxID=9 RepID=UPI0031B8A131
MKNIVFIVKIAFNIPVNKIFSYLYNLREFPIIGGRVIVNFNNKKIIGIILSYKIYNNKKKYFKLKYVNYVIDKVSIFNNFVWKTILKCSEYYECSINFIIFFGIPNFIKNGKIFKHNLKYFWYITNYGKKLNLKIIKMCKKKIFIIKLLKKNVLYVDDVKKYNLSNYILNLLKKENICKKKNIFFKKKNNEIFNLINKNVIKVKKNIEIKLEKIIKNLNSFKVWLLTNSLFHQKIKFYILLFRKVLKYNLKILLIVSNYYLLNKFKKEIEKNIFVSIYSYHSNLTEKKKSFYWKIFRKKHPAIIISTKIGIFVPIVNLGILILDEENSNSYKIVDKWTFNIKNVFLIRSYFEKIPIILESSEPELNTLHNVYKNKIKKIKISNKIINYYKNLNKILINMNNERFKGVFSISLINKINIFLKKNNNICILIDNISNIFFFIKCYFCKSILKCNFCNQICEFKIYEKKIFCRFCFFDKNIFFSCFKCGSKKFYYKKCNISFLIKNIQEVFPKIPIFFLKEKNIKNNFSFLSKSIFLIKNENIYKYKLNNIDLLVLLYIDYYFNLPYFKHIEIFSQKYYGIIRLFLDNFNFSFTIIIQTKLIKNSLFNKFFYCGYMIFSEYLLYIRKKYNLPPFNFHAIIRLESKNKKKVFILLKKILIIFNKSYIYDNRDFFFISCNNIYFNKYNNYFYSKILLSHSSKLFLRKIFRKLKEYFKNFLYINNINIFFDIDTVQTI